MPTTQDWVVVVVYCAGSVSVEHADTPIAVYRRVEDGWIPLHSGVFRGEPFTTSDGGIDHLVANAQVSEADYLQRMGVDDGARRSQYRWHCSEPACFDLMANDIDTVHRMFDVHAAEGEISLARIDALHKANAKRRNTRRGGR